MSSSGDRGEDDSDRLFTLRQALRPVVARWASGEGRAYQLKKRRGEDIDLRIYLEGACPKIGYDPDEGLR